MLARYEEDMTPVQAPVGSIQREEFGGNQMQRLGETSAIAVAAKEKAMVEARYIMALRQPRDWDVARQKLLRRCKSPSFAARAIYSKPVGGKKIEGLSIRFVEEALRSMGNVLTKPSIVFQDDNVVIYNVSVTDLENNLTYESDVMVEKTVERSSVKEGQEVIGSRLNSYGKTTYLVRATEDDMLNKLNARLSKAIRNNGLRLVPGDIIEDAEQECRRTMRRQDAQDPDAAKKAIVDSFSEIGVTAAALKEFVGHDLGILSPAELGELRQMYRAIKDGEATWHEFSSAKSPVDAKTEEAPAKPDGLKERLAQKAAAVQQTQVTPAATPPPQATPADEEDDLAGLDEHISQQQASTTEGRRGRPNGFRGTRGL